MTILSIAEPRAGSSDAPLATARRASERRLAGERGESRLTAKTVTIDRPREELYRFWRALSCLPQFMENVERIDVLDDRRSHWVVRAPAGQTVEWDAIITDDEPGEYIAWESVAGATIRNSGRVEFRDAQAGRGTEVTAVIAYDPPAGAVGKLIATLLQREPRIQVKRELRRFKQLMETGEIATADPPRAAPRAS